MSTDIVASAVRRESTPHFVYRLFDADDRLLYIGASLNVVARIKDHKKKAWAADIARHTVEGPFIGPDAAKARESEAIRTERPLFNVTGRWADRATFTADDWTAYIAAIENLRGPSTRIRDRHLANARAAAAKAAA